MKVKFTSDVELEIIESFEEALDDAESTTEVFKQDTVVDFDVFGYGERMIDGELVEDRNLLNVQFADGSVAFGVSTEWFEQVT